MRDPGQVCKVEVDPDDVRFSCRGGGNCVLFDLINGTVRPRTVEELEAAVRGQENAHVEIDEAALTIRIVCDTPPAPLPFGAHMRKKGVMTVHITK